MSTMVLEEAVVKLVGDHSQYTKSMGEAAKVTTKSVDEMKGGFGGLVEGARSVNEGLEGLKSGILAVAAAGVIGELVKTALETGEALHKLSIQTGINVESLQELHFAADRTGVSQDTLNSALLRLNRSIGEAINGNKEMSATFGAMGVDIRDAAGKVRPTEEVFRDITNNLANTESAAERASKGTTLFGRQFSEIIPLVAGGTKGLDEAAKAAHELGIVLSEETVKAAAETNIKFKIMSDVIKSDLMNAVLALAPALMATADIITATAVAIGKLGSITKQWFGEATVATDEQEHLAKLMHDGIGAYVGSTLAIGNMTDATKKSNDSFAERKKLIEETNKLLEKDKKGGGDKEKEVQAEIAMLERAAKMRDKIDGDVSKAITLRQKALTTMKEDAATKEIEDLLAKNELMRGLKDSAYAGDIAANQAKIDTLLTQETVGSDNYVKLRLKVAKEDKKISDDTKRDRMDTLSSIATLSNAKTKEIAIVGKTAAIAIATVDTYVGANKALAAFPPPFNFIAAGAVITAGLLNVANIAGVGFKEGVDMVPGRGTGDRVPAMLEPGERVVPKRTNKMLEQSLRQGGGVGGAVRIELSMRGNLSEFIEAKLIERGRLTISQEA